MTARFSWNQRNTRGHRPRLQGRGMGRARLFRGNARYLRIPHRSIVQDARSDHRRLLQSLRANALVGVYIGVVSANVVIVVILDGLEARQANRDE